MNKLLMLEMSCAFLFVGMIVCSYVCYRFGQRSTKDGKAQTEVTGVVSGAVFALLGLLIAFTFSGANTRFDARRQLIVQEVNAIESMHGRLDLLPAAAQPALKGLLQDYAASRAALYDKLSDPEATKAELATAARLGKALWQGILAATAEPQYASARALLVNAMDDMLDIVTLRSAAIRSHPPLSIWAMLFLIAFACAGLTGHRAGVTRNHWSFNHVLLAAVLTCVLYVILDIEHPRHGLVRLDGENHSLVELAHLLKQAK